jgi:lysophospholipase L1-like esterase
MPKKMIGFICPIALLLLTTGVMHGMAQNGPRWVATWSTAPQATPPLDSGFAPPFGEGFNYQTIRSIAHTSIGGAAVRVRITNLFGTQPVTFNAVYIGKTQTGATLVSGSNHALTFGGGTAVTIPAGAEVWSDALPFNVPSDQNLAVSLFAQNATGTPTIHAYGMQTTYIADGNFAASEDGSAFTGTDANWYFVDGVDVLASPRVKGAVVAIGDSITEGDGSTQDANRRWPNNLARRLLAGPPGLELSVLDQGMGANRVLNDSPCFGENMVSRIDRDVLGQAGVQYLILLAGVADIGFPNFGFTFVCLDPNPDVSANQIIAAYEQIIAKAHAKGVKVIGGTLTPIKDAFFGWTPETEAKRQSINAFIQTSRSFDGVIDFATAVADPGDPAKLAPQFDSGDHVHPNDAGNQAMANAINLSLFLPRR